MARIVACAVLLVVAVLLKFVYLKPFYQIFISIAYMIITAAGFFNIIYGSELPSDLLTIELLYNLVMIFFVSGILF
jgi:hypothetical protein